MSSDDVPTEMLDKPPEVSRLIEGRFENTPVQIDDAPFAPEAERYQFIATIGKGGMGEIRLARDTHIARQVAVKVLNPKLNEQRDFRSRFLVEARLQGQLEHPSIVPVHDLGETEDGELFFSMKAVRGVTLHDALKAVKKGDLKYSRRRLLTAFSSVCLAVDFAHSRSVVHRDLKPANVMLGDFGEVYVLDWGIAKLVDMPETPIETPIELPPDSDAAATRAGKVLGTPAYMAPERRLHGIADRRTDVFALGVMLEELLAADKRHDTPPELTSIVARATNREPELRFSTARELHDVLERYLDGDRDLELRRTQSERHAQLAEQTLERTDDNARVDAGREIGRALGLDPSNERALRTLMRLLSEMPAKMPPAAQAEIDRVWQARRSRTLRLATLVTCGMLLYVPFILWMGVRSWPLFGVWLAFTVMAIAGQYWGSRDERTMPFVAALVSAMSGMVVLSTSLGVTGILPAALALLAMAWRMSVRRWLHGVLVLAGLAIAVCAPFVLPASGITKDTYSVRDGTIVITPHMHDFPADATWMALVLGTIGGVAGALLFGRLYANEIRRVEERLTFHAWQLQQLLAR